MAWETLKKRLYTIDLILTEAELPSISGYALLALVTEHDLYKNTPVIMMSSQDSISMVFKCILKGAADFLIKPIRRNELRNLWQHVWRRHSLIKGCTAQNFPTSPNRVEAISENSDNSSFCASPPKRSFHINNDRGTQAVSLPHVAFQDISQMKDTGTSNVSNGEGGNHEERVRLETKSMTPDSNAMVSFGESSNRSKQNIYNTHMNTDPRVGETNTLKSFAEVRSKKENIIAIPLGGDEDEQARSSSGGDTGQCKLQLQLSLQKPSATRADSEVRDGRTLMHSRASAFSGYMGKAVNPARQQGSSNHAVPKDDATVQKDTRSNPSFQDAAVRFQHHLTTFTGQEFVTPPLITQPTKADAAYHVPHVRVIPTHGAMYGHPFPISFHSHPGLFPSCPPKASCQTGQSPLLANETHLISGGKNNQGNEEMDRPSITSDSPAAGYGSHGLCKVVSCNGSGRDCVGANLGGSRLPSQREAALTKFRLKRKDRCYEKKVRYQSRKKLADQRPRLKGQFTRQS